MKAEISHHGFLREDKYTGVYLQQGTMITDRDFNALCERLKAQINRLGDKTVGTGIPKSQGLLTGFIPTGSPVTQWSAAFRPEGGYVAADGMIGFASPAITEETIVAVPAAERRVAARRMVRGKSAPKVADTPTRNDDEMIPVEIVEAPPFSFHNQADLPGANAVTTTEGYYYADIWDEVVTALDDNDLLDPGLHGAHTAFTTRRRVQIKKCNPDHIEQFSDKARQTNGQINEKNDTHPCGFGLNSKHMPSIGSGIFTIAPRDQEAGPDSCDPCAEHADTQLDLGNYLFRVEVHNVFYNADGTPKSVQLKWSSENGAIQTPVPETGAALNEEYSYEFFTASTDLNMGLPTGGYADQPERGKLLHGGVSDIPEGDFMRRWDGFIGISLIDGTVFPGHDKRQPMNTGIGAMKHGHVNFEDGVLTLVLETVKVTLNLMDKDLLTGDYWLALARSNTDWKIRALSETPIGIQHHYCLLGYSEDGIHFPELTPGHKRRLHFPELNCIHAEDVNYQPGSCTHAEGATNVQEGLDAICAAIPKYKVLKMSGGDGQEGLLGHTLPAKIRVLVEDQDGYAEPGAEVKFTVAGSDSLMPATPVTTNADGLASVEWKVGGQPGLHELTAELLTPPQNDSGKKICKIQFSALAYEEKKSDFPFVKKITWADGSKFRNDAHADFGKILKGFIIHFSEPIIEELVTPDVLTLHMETFKDSRDTGRFEHYSVILCGKVETGAKKATFIPIGIPGFDNEGNFTPLSDDPIATNTGTAGTAAGGAAGHPGTTTSPGNIATPAVDIAAGPADIDVLGIFRKCSPDGIRFRIRLRGRFVFNKEGRPFDAFIPGMPVVDSFQRSNLGKDFELAANAASVAVIQPDTFTSTTNAVMEKAILALATATSAAATQTGTRSARKTSAAKTEPISAARVVDSQLGAAAARNVRRAIGDRPGLTAVAARVFDKAKLRAAGVRGIRMVGPRRITLNYNTPGLGHPSDLQAWFYFDPNKKPQNLKTELKPVISVNIATKKELKFEKIFNEDQAERIVAAQPHIRDMAMLRTVLEVDAKKTKNLQSRLSFREWFREKPQGERDLKKFKPELKPKPKLKPKAKAKLKPKAKAKPKPKRMARSLHVPFNSATGTAFAKGLGIKPGPAKKIVTMRNRLIKERKGKPFTSMKQLLTAMEKAGVSENLRSILGAAKDKLSFEDQ